MPLDDDIKALNLRFLLVLRDAALRDTPAACYQFDVTKDFVGKITAMSLEQLHAFADCESLYFRPRISAAAISHLTDMPPARRSPFVEIGALAQA